MQSPLNPSSVEQFLQALRLDRGAADLTLEAYRRDLGQFVGSFEHASIENAGREDIERWIHQLHHSGQSAASVARKISAIRQFFKFCCREGLIQNNPADQLESPRLAHRLPKALSAAEIDALLLAAQSGLYYQQNHLREALQARDRLLILVLYATGGRISEVIGLTHDRIDFQNLYIRVRGKGNKERIAPLANTAAVALAKYLESERPSLKPASDHVFVNHRGGALSRQAAWQIIESLAREAGLGERKISPHVLRHSFATHLLEGGMGLRSLQILLGHADLSTTQIYTKITPEHLQETHRRYHPRGGG